MPEQAGRERVSHVERKQGRLMWRQRVRLSAPHQQSPPSIHIPSLPENLYWGLAIGSQDNVVSPTPSPRGPSDPVPQAPALWIETTAYGLLHLLLREGKGEMADKAASWLTHQGSFQGGFRSTQVGAATALGRGF